MGMYTQLTLAVELKKDKEMLDILNKMIKMDYSELTLLSAHPLFECPRVSCIFHCGSYYFNAEPFVKLVDNEIRTTLTTCFNLKNYDDEIQKFLDWLCPYIETEGYIGTYRYEEEFEPTNIYKVDERIKIGEAFLDNFSELEITSKPFDWNDNLAKVAFEDFSNIKKDLPYYTYRRIVMALAKLEILENQGCKVKY